MEGFLDTIQCGDATSILRQVPNRSANLVVTSPPYYQQRRYNGHGLGIGHEACPDLYLDALMEGLAECIRIVKPTGSIVYNLGDKYVDGSLQLLPFRFALLACEKFGLKLINEITWVKRNPTPRQFERRLVSSTEPFFHFAVRDDYYYDRRSFCHQAPEVKQAEPGPNVGQKYFELIDGAKVLSDEQKKLARTSLSQAIQEVHRKEISGFRMKIKGIHAEAFGGQEGGRKIQMEKRGFTIIKLRGEKMKRDVIECQVENLKGNPHTAIFPLTIIREMIRLLCPQDGVVIDPYVGSGTTAVAAIAEKRHYLGIDIDPDYCVAARQRAEQAMRKKNEGLL